MSDKSWAAASRPSARAAASRSATTSHRQSLALLGGSVVGALLTLIILQASHSWADADRDPATDTLTRVIPYTGRLEKDGVALTGTADLRFRLYTRGAAAAGYVWSATYTGTNAVRVVGGRFQVLLGDNTPLTAAVNDAEELYLGVEVQRNGVWESLGKQLVAPTTFALWTPQSTNLRVGGTLSVGGTATVGALALTGEAAFPKVKSAVVLGGGATSTTRTGTHGGVFPGTTANNGVALRYATASNVLSIDRRSDGAALFSVDADNGNLSVAGPATFGAASRASGNVTLLQGRDVVVPGSSTVTLSRATTNRSGMTLGSDVTGEGFALLWNPGYGIGQLRFGNNVNSGTVLMSFFGTVQQVSVTKNIEVDGDLVLTNTTTSGFSTIEGDTERFFKNDSSCPFGALRAAVIESASAICMCRADGADDQPGRGWYCIQ